MACQNSPDLPRRQQGLTSTGACGKRYPGHGVQQAPFGTQGRSGKGDPPSASEAARGARAPVPAPARRPTQMPPAPTAAPPRLPQQAPRPATALSGPTPWRAGRGARRESGPGAAGAAGLHTVPQSPRRPPLGQARPAPVPASSPPGLQTHRAPLSGTGSDPLASPRPGLPGAGDRPSAGRHGKATPRPGTPPLAAAGSGRGPPGRPPHLPRPLLRQLHARTPTAFGATRMARKRPAPTPLHQSRRGLRRMRCGKNRWPRACREGGRRDTAGTGSTPPPRPTLLPTRRGRGHGQPQSEGRLSSSPPGSPPRTLTCRPPARPRRSCTVWDRRAGGRPRAAAGARGGGRRDREVGDSRAARSSGWIPSRPSVRLPARCAVPAPSSPPPPLSGH